MTTMQSMSDADLLAYYRDAFGPDREPSYYDHGGEILAAWQDAILVEMERRGFKPT